MKNELISRPYVKEDYTIVREWWGAHNDAFLENEVLPNHGVVVSHKRDIGWVPCCASWIYFAANAKMAQIGFTVTQPNAPLRVKHAAVQEAIRYLHGLAHAMGYHTIITISDKSGLTKAYLRAGFKPLPVHDFLVHTKGKDA